MLFTSPYRALQIPQDVTAPEFVLHPASDELEKKPLFHVTSHSRRTDAKPLALADVRHGAYSLATALLSSEVMERPCKKGDVFVFYTENQHDYILCALGVMLAGGVPALLNPMYKPDEVKHIFDILQPRAILASKATYKDSCDAAELYSKKSGTCIDVWVMNEHHERSYIECLCKPGAQIRASGDRSVENVIIDPTKDEAVYCLSSGTSGLPKAVRLSHFNLIANTIQMTVTLGGRVNKPVYDAANWYDQPDAPAQSGENEVHYSLLPQFHCYGLITALICLHTLTPSIVESKFKPENFFHAVQEHKVTFSFVVPPIMIALVKSPLAEKYDLSSVKSFASGAASLSKELCDMLRDMHRIEVTDGYGMTEMSPIIALQTQADLSLHKLNVGRLVSNTEAMVMDINHKKPVGPNQLGELWVRGPQMMLGYLRNQEANDVAFADAGDGRGLFLRTGDIVTIDEKGYISIRDRLKDIIKYNGYQVAASEIEALVFSLPFVLDCAVVGKVVEDDITKNELPWAFVVAKEKGSDHKRTEALLQHVNEQVAGFKKLRGVTWVDELPRSAAGKVLKRELRARLSKE